jgi:hypothetical protein
MYIKKHEKMPKYGKKLFLRTSELCGSADLGLGEIFQIYTYITGYKLSGDTLVDAFIKGHIKNFDNYIYSVIYNYKQFLELSMKTIYYLHANETLESIEHNITRVNENLELTWDLIEPLLNQIYTSPEEVVVMKAAKEYIIEFQFFNERSFDFIYPFTIDIITSSQIEKRIDVINLKERIEELYQFFKQSDWALVDYLESKNSDTNTS